MQKQKLKILFVEDDIDAVKYATNSLVRNNFEVVSTGSGRKAIEYIKQSTFDIVLLDLSLEDITGIEVLDLIRSFNKSLKIVIVTGSILKWEEREKICALGVHKFLGKPSNTDKMLEAIKFALNAQECIPLSELPEWQFEPGHGLMSRHELKGILGSLNMQCANFLSDIELGRISSMEEHKKFTIILEEIKDIHGKIKKACEAINKEIAP